MNTQALRDLIAKAKTEEVINKLLKLVDSDLNHQVTMLSASYKNYENTKHSGVESPKVLKRELRKINDALLHIINNIPIENIDKKSNQSKPFKGGDFDKPKKNFNPYKFLKYYDTSDSKYFFGRDDLIHRAFDIIKVRFESKINKNILCILGQSGSGKSSFLRAGLIAKIHKELPNDINTVIFRPSDIGIKFKDPLLRILDCIEDQTDIKITSRIRDDIKHLKEAAAVYHLENQVRKLASDKKVEKIKLIFCIDQFEEIIDFFVESKDKNNDAHLMTLLRFIEAVGNSDLMGVVYSMETSRKYDIKKLSLNISPIFTDGTYEIDIDGYNSDLIYNIIKEPFKACGYDLSSEAIRKIEKNIKQLIKDEDIITAHSLLPFISLYLSYLFESERKNANTGNDSEDVEKLDFNEIIGYHADRVWKGCNVFNKQDDNKGDLDFFLQPFIGISGLNYDQLKLRIINNPSYQEEQKLAKIFEENRLIVRTADGGMRLLNQAIITQWKLAKEWYEEKKVFLKKEIIYRYKAGKWNDNERPTLNESKISEEDISSAAEILSCYLRSWAIRDKDSIPLKEEDQLLCDYCKAVFSLSKTPTKYIEYMGKPTSPHVYRAAQYGLKNLVEVFYEIDPNCLEMTNLNTQNTPLVAASWGHKEVVEYLLKKGIKPKLEVLKIPILQDNSDIFNLLLGEISDTDSLEANIVNILHSCAQYGRIGMAHSLITKYKLKTNGKDSNEWTSLHYAAYHGQVDFFKFFATYAELKITDIVIDNCSVLHLAVYKRSVNMVEYIIGNKDFSTDFFNLEDKDGQTALHIAAQNHYPEVVELLLKVCDPNKVVADINQERALHLAVNIDHLIEDKILFTGDRIIEDRIIETIKILLNDFRTDPNATDINGYLPLSKAVKLDKVIKLFLENPKVNPMHPVSPRGKNPFIIAFKLKMWEDVNKILADPNIDFSQQEKKVYPNLTSLLSHIFDKERNIDKEEKEYVLSKVVEKSGLNLCKEKDYFGWTPLHRFIATRNIDAINWLRGQHEIIGELWEQTDNIGRKPIELADKSLKIELGFEDEPNNWGSPKSWDSNIDWMLVESDLRTVILDKFSIIDETYPVDLNSDIKKGHLSFYVAEKIEIIRIKSENWNNSELSIYFIKSDEQYYRLNGESKNIHEINKQTPIVLNKENVLDYLRFFCFFVHGSGGPFIIAEGLNQHEIPPDLTTEELQEIEKVIRPADLVGFDEETNEFIVMTTVFYFEGIFYADFGITKEGYITMIDDLPVISGLSKSVNAPLA